jgi:hypothetical protein
MTDNSGPVVLGLSSVGATNVLAFLEAHRDGQAFTEQQIDARDWLIYLLEGNLYGEHKFMGAKP